MPARPRTAALHALVSLLLVVCASVRGDPYTCQEGDADCFCSWKNDFGTFADPMSCVGYFMCSKRAASYQTCGEGLLFSSDCNCCNWSDDVELPAEVCNYSIKSGDTLSALAATYGTDVSTLESLNMGVKATALQIGQELKVPCLEGGSAEEEPAPSPSSEEEDAEPAAPMAICTHTVKSGDTLSALAAKYGTDLSTVESLNVGVKATALQIGQKLDVPCTEEDEPVEDDSPSTPQPSGPPADLSGMWFAGYFPSWAERAAETAEASQLAQLPRHVNMVILAFIRPDMTYDGGLTFEGTGLELHSSPSIVKESIALLKQNNPGTKVTVSVGGASYHNIEALNAEGIAKFVEEFGLDGVDLDYEPEERECEKSKDGKISCKSDEAFVTAIKALRTALPRPLLVTAAAWSVGAYGEGDFADSQPKSSSTGVALSMLREVGSEIDVLNVMAFNAGPELDPLEVYRAYRHYYDGAILIGVSVPPEAWGGHEITLEEVDTIAEYMKEEGGSGLMLWSLLTEGTPSAQDLASRACERLALSSDCDAPLFP